MADVHYPWRRLLRRLPWRLAAVPGALPLLLGILLAVAPGSGVPTSALAVPLHAVSARTPASVLTLTPTPAPASTPRPAPTASTADVSAATATAVPTSIQTIAPAVTAPGTATPIASGRPHPTPPAAATAAGAGPTKTATATASTTATATMTATATATMTATTTPTPTPVPGYLLPWPGGEALVCVQGNGGAFSHQGLEVDAWDFAMPAGSVITAARGGIVRFVRDDSDLGGPFVAVFGDDSNYVVIDHGDGTSAQYLHLMYHGALVQVGQRVDRGQSLAYSGATGFAAGPHLHFMVERTDPGAWYTQSLPTSFADVPDDGVPVAGGTYRSGNTRTAIQRTTAVVPLASPPPVPVPALVGLTVQQAQAALLPWGLVLALDPAQPSATLPPGRLAAQQPGAGAAVALGAVVHVAPSSGPPTPTPTATATATARTTATATPTPTAPATSAGGPSTPRPAPTRDEPPATPVSPTPTRTVAPVATARPLPRP